jgi:L-methionine (R)-S-oxide reductase
MSMDIAAAITAAESDDDVLRIIVGHFLADSGTIHMLGEDGRLHLCAATAGMPPQVMETIRTIPVGKGMAGLAVERRQPVDACNIQTDTSGDVRPGARATSLAGAIVVPIFRDDEVVGALGIANRAERTFTETEIDGLMQAGRSIAGRQ